MAAAGVTGFAVPPEISPQAKRRPEEEVIHPDKVNALLSSSTVHDWAVSINIRKVDTKGEAAPAAALSSKVDAKQARLVMTELRTRMPQLPAGAAADWRGQGVPRLAEVLVGGMVQMKSLERDDVKAGGVEGADLWEAFVEVGCHTDFKRLVAYRVCGPVTEGEAKALKGALRRLGSLQRNSSGQHHRPPFGQEAPPGASAAAAVVAGLLCWDREEV
uniref:Uncharacterized protein n=1 Tax=Hemiselmis tepida TaxID=464990 RepID=A0A7S0YU32_9CRYP|mmetsp:Transcript_21548/g.54361  ORF Transcript_21548/g.54361 Transcript_21548/m.54361 type:complete len:217 (+) Transcript_21548:183-833(+)|eukprot:CAMPEP_0174923798 /NCGR_PEP_ID=MMETSP1355-20121228/6829_1 /TAXON_ID=464990 /ORGANISM="Hemiselmis tepida, Strain CCMP443" /LENGTH=216 /DNA_ID=CAMNT_0016169531 /DNA_START=183 /DNA_END=833 /DNA_ORIENTATION=-